MSDLNISGNVNELSKADIIELDDKIKSFERGEQDPEKFRSFRLSRGVYGQRQEGVQMIRIKLPFGRFSADQLIRIADVADKYATNKMHITTRQDIQIHYVKMTDSPQLWAELEDAGITLKEACGNTVRNVTASPAAGIDPDELFDVSPYAHAFYDYFLRNPICQDMGRKFKVAFSSSDKDTGLTFMHDLGFVPRIVDGKKGFKVVIGGGLGSQPVVASLAHEFIPVEEMIPYSEAVIRVFDRYGERASRGKARLKFLVKKIGLEELVRLIDEEKTAVINKVYPIDESLAELAVPAERTAFEQETPVDEALFVKWRESNVFAQKQEGFYGVTIKVQLGNVYNDTARSLAQIVKEGFCADDIRATQNQGFVLKYVREDAIVGLFNRLEGLGLANPGFDSAADITACPGTDTCNLGIASSYGIAVELERVIDNEYEELIYNHDIKIKISGCMNACGQHNSANIGLQGMTIKKGAYVMPALQILLGGGFDASYQATTGDKIVKVPSKVAPDAFRAILNDFEANALEGEYFNNFYQRKKEEDKMYFFSLLKPFTIVPEEIPEHYFTDWGDEEKYVKAIGVGECAGVVLDMVGALIMEAEEKFALATKTIGNGNWQDSIYHSYNSFVVAAKALLIGEDVKCNTQITIMRDFDETFIKAGLMTIEQDSFEAMVTQLNKIEPSLEFAQAYYAQAKEFIAKVKVAREEQIARG